MEVGKESTGIAHSKIKKCTRASLLRPIKSWENNHLKTSYLEEPLMTELFNNYRTFSQATIDSTMLVKSLKSTQWLAWVDTEHFKLI
jgi:hypothetical protein